jgi:hypothetical protein
MFTKNLFKTKTFWGGLASIVTGAGIVVGGDVNSGIVMIGMGILAVFGRDAMTKIQG